MVKLIIFAVLGLFVGLGGGSAFSVLKAKTAFASQEARRAKVVADSVSTAQEGRGAKTAPHVEKDSSAAPVEDESVAEPVAGEKPETPVAGATPKESHAKETPRANVSHASEGEDFATTPSAATTASATSTKWNRAVTTIKPSELGGKAKLLRPAPKGATPPSSITPEKMGKIFAAMPAKEAAKVLEQLDDNDVQAILGSLSGKQAAAILQSLPATRAAAISRAAIRSGGAKP